MTKLRVSEIFPSIQGEGVQIGTPMTFIRLVGCNLTCSWCDTKYALFPKSGHMMTIDSIVKKVQGHGLDWVCITGGEPLIQNIEPLVRNLKRYGFPGEKVTVETNGTIKPTTALNSLVDLWTASPKVGHWHEPVLLSMRPLQLKIVVIEGMMIDLDKWRSVEPDYIVLQPCALTPYNIDWNRKIMRGIAEYVVDEGWNDVRVLPQLQKYLWGNERGR